MIIRTRCQYYRIKVPIVLPVLITLLVAGELGRHVLTGLVSPETSSILVVLATYVSYLLLSRRAAIEEARWRRIEEVDRLNREEIFRQRYRQEFGSRDHVRQSCPEEVAKAFVALGLPESASAKEIKGAYRKLVWTCHPDRFPGDKAKEERFKEIQAAYDLLQDR